MSEDQQALPQGRDFYECRILPPTPFLHNRMCFFWFLSPSWQVCRQKFEKCCSRVLHSLGQAHSYFIVFILVISSAYFSKFLFLIWNYYLFKTKKNWNFLSFLNSQADFIVFSFDFQLQTHILFYYSIFNYLYIWIFYILVCEL